MPNYTKKCRAMIAAMALGSFLVLSPVALTHAAEADYTGKTITAVTVTGSNLVPVPTIQSHIHSKPGDKMDPKAIQEDLHSIYDMGCFFNVVPHFTEVPEGVQVNYVVMENPVLQDITITGNTRVSTDKLQSLLTVKTGEVLNSATLHENMRAIEKYYHDEGYILAKVADVSMQEGGHLHLTISEGILEGIVVKGNTKTKTKVITREMKLKTGEPFNVKTAKRSMQKIYNLGYFEDVNMKLNPGREPNSVILETDVVEQKTGTFSIGAGYSKQDGMMGLIDVGEKNLRGTGDKINLHWEFGGKGSHNRNYEVSYQRPWLDDKETSLGVSFYNMTNQYHDYARHSDRGESTYDRQRRGWELTLGRPQGEFRRNYITLKDRKDSYVEHVDGVLPTPEFLADNFGQTRSVTLSHVYDSRDNVFNPSEGARYSVSAELAGKGLGGDFDFNKYTLEARRYFKTGHDRVIAVRSLLGYSTGRLPEMARFSVGGSDTLRGYDDGEFEGGNMFSATAEYRFPLVKKVQGVVFADAGNAWTGNYTLPDLKYSAGVGIRLSTPIGPIRLDYGRGSEGGRTHFSFGGQF